MDSEKNLHTPADGIFETHVTWEDIEKDIRAVLKTSATFGPNKTIKNIGDGNGFASRICLVEPDWQNVRQEESLPEKFVAKLCTAIAILDLTKKMAEAKGIKNFLNLESSQHFDEIIKKAHNTEVHIYNLLSKYNVTAVPRPKIYCARKFDKENPLKGFLIMEFIDDLAVVHIFSTIKPEETHQALRAIAAFEAMTFKLTEEEKEVFHTRPLTDIMGLLFTEESVQSVCQFLEKYEGEESKEDVKKLITIVPKLVDTVWYDSIPDQLKMTKVLCHGDLWSANILWKKNGNTQSVAAIIDYQTAHLGNPAGDLSRFICSNLEGEERVKHTDELLKTFYTFLLEELGPLPLPYTLEQLKEAYRRYQPVSGFMIAPICGSALDLFIDKVPEEERAHAKKVLDGKVHALVKEVLIEHERNKLLTEKQ